MTRIVVSILTFVTLAIGAVAQEAKQKECAVAAYTDYNKANLALLTKLTGKI